MEVGNETSSNIMHNRELVEAVDGKIPMGKNEGSVWSHLFAWVAYLSPCLFANLLACLLACWPVCGISVLPVKQPCCPGSWED